MIVVKSPCRVSLSSCDHEPFSSRFGGLALNMSIDKYVYIIIRKRTDLEIDRYRISYSKTELCNDVEQINHVIVREAMKLAQVDDPLEVLYAADLPGGCGLATSTAMAASLLKGLYYYRSVGISNDLLAEQTYQLEREYAKEAGGFQDQWGVIFGGIQLLGGSPGRVIRTPILFDDEQAKKLTSHMLLVYTGEQQNSCDILQEQLVKLRKGETLDETFKIKQLVKEMYALLIDPDFRPMDIAPAMNELWELKKKLASNMSSELTLQLEQIVKNIYPDAGLRLVGGGGGRGFMLALAPPEYHDEIKRQVAPRMCSSFNVDWNGVRIIYKDRTGSA